MSGFIVPLERASKNYRITHVVDQTVRRELPKELQKVDFTKKTDKIIHDITCRILQALNDELIANNLSMGLESPAAYHRSQVYTKVEKAFNKLKPQLPPKN